MRVRRAVAVLAGTAVVPWALGCSADRGSAGAGTVTVLAAASLTDVFTELAAAFEADQDDLGVELSFGASPTLREQVLAGAPADVFASADERDMDTLAAAGAVAGRVHPFATNGLAIVVPAGNPGGVRGAADLGDRSLLIGLCAAHVPCGRLAREVLARAGVAPALDTETPDVRALLTQVVAGELDAAVVYRTDVLAAGSAVEAIALRAPGADAVATLPIAALRDADDRAAADAFVAFVVSPRGRAILARHGFGPP